MYVSSVVGITSLQQKSIRGVMNVSMYMAPNILTQMKRMMTLIVNQSRQKKTNPNSPSPVAVKRARLTPKTFAATA